jgi:hypothetical protein
MDFCLRACERIGIAPSHLAPLAGRGRNLRACARIPGEGQRRPGDDEQPPRRPSPRPSPGKRGEGELCSSDPGNAPFLYRLLSGNDGMSRVGFISSIPSQPRKGGIRGRAQGLMGCPLFKPGQALDPAFRGDDNPLIEPAPFRAVDYVSGARARFDLSMLCRSAFSENAKSRRVAARPAVDDPFAAEIIVVEQTGSRRPQSAPARRK